MPRCLALLALVLAAEILAACGDDSPGTGRATATTFFAGRDGATRCAKLGGCPDAARLEADIRRYAR